jgi:oligopeptide transport system substrate-binding protein
VVSAVLVAALLAACSNDKGRESAERPTGEIRRGGTLRIGVVRPSSLDPARARTVDEQLVVDQLFDSLTTHDPKTLEPLPSIAERWESTPDQLHWAFHLRADAVFANGRQITSADVKYTLDRIAQRGSGSSVADLLEPITGFRAVNVDGTATELAGVTTPSPTEVKIDLDQPWSVLPSVLGTPAFGIVPREAVEAAEPVFGDRPLGSGPFSLRERDDRRLVLAPVAEDRALVARLEVVLFDDADASYAAFEKGDLEWSQVPAEQVEAAAADHGRAGFRPYLAELFYGFNLKNPKFADGRFREAIVRAIDRRAIVSAVYGGTVRLTEGLIVDGVTGHQDEPCGERCIHDPQRARELVLEVFGGAPAHEIAIDYDDDKTQEAVAKAMQANLGEVGISAVLRPKPLREYQEFAVSGNQELFRLGWIGAYPSADAFLQPLFLTGAPSNLTGFSAGPVDEGLRAARSEPDPGRRTELYRNAERAIMEQLPVVPIAQFEVHAVSAATVRGLELTAAGTFDASRVWLAAS